MSSGHGGLWPPVRVEAGCSLPLRLRGGRLGQAQVAGRHCKPQRATGVARIASGRAWPGPRGAHL